MGAGASASEQNELRAAFAEFDPSMSHEDCRVLLEKHAPTLMARMTQGTTEGDDNSSIMAGVAALHDQFTMAHHKLRGGGQGQNAGENSGGATSTADVAEAAELAAARKAGALRRHPYPLRLAMRHAASPRPPRCVAPARTPATACCP